jgi:hypothetical protein
LALDEKGELFVAFTYFPRVRKYSSGGVLLAEFKIESPIMEAKETYNRGIARAHKGDFEKAIGDFERAAKLDAKFAVKAREQIDYCRGRLKKKEIRTGPPGKMPDEIEGISRGGTSAF